MTEWNSKHRLTRRYDQSAKVYDVQYRQEQMAKIRTVLDNLTLSEDSVVLDTGCGTGLLITHVAGKVKFLVGIDISRGLLKEAKKKAKLYKNVALILADADNLPFAEKAFDAVFAITLLQNMPSPLSTLNEIKRVNKSNAAMAVSGLRKAFTEDGFSKILKRANLKIAALKLDEQMREYIAICIKIRR